MQKIMYLCPVDWRWIKQRPQFLAEELSLFFDVQAVYPYKNNRRGLQDEVHTQVKLTPWFTLPTFGGKLRFIGKINAVLSKVQMMMALRKIKPDIIWFSMPWQIDAFPDHLSCRVVYDCMDDYAAISTDQARIEALIQQESKLVRRADLIFASSENLRSVLARRHGIDREKIKLLRNGYNANWSIQEKRKAFCNHEKKVQIGYFGTIGRWFDFELLLNSLKQYPQIEYRLFGPLEVGVRIPQHTRLIYCGVLEHDKLREQADRLDALMMPFVVNDIVRSVDPVKLYEYICFNKRILCVWYKEIERFDQFVCFYNNIETYFQCIESLLIDSRPIYSAEQARCFLENNTWGCRAKTAYEAIEEIYGIFE